MSLANSVGSVILLSRKSSLSRGYSLSTPAIDISLFDRRFNAVIAGKGFLVREWRESIMQFDRLSARKAVREARQSGISLNKLEERSREWSVLANGAKLEAVIEVRPLSARLKCLRNLHFDDGNIPMERRFDELPRGLCHPSDILECELPDPDLLTLYVPLR